MLGRPLPCGNHRAWTAKNAFWRRSHVSSCRTKDSNSSLVQEHDWLFMALALSDFISRSATCGAQQPLLDHNGCWWSDTLSATSSSIDYHRRLLAAATY